jgi:hypothetical protein
MSDAADKAAKEQAIHLNNAIQAARQAPSQLKGPLTCKCGDPNDRALQGFCVCTACMEEAQNG